VVLLAVVVVSRADNDEAVQWLMKMNDAAGQVTYAGTFVYVHAGRIEAMQVFHRRQDDGMRERLYSLNGAAREIVRDDHQVWCYLPDQKLGVHEYRQVSDRSFPRLLPERISPLTTHYDITLGGRDRIAQRDVQQVMIRPRDGYRYGYDLWADSETGLLLKAVLTSAEGVAIEQYMFTHLDIGAEIEDADLEPVNASEDLVWSSPGAGQDTRRDKPTQWTVDGVPAGFELTRHVRRMSPARKQAVEHLVYSDTLAAVSVFIERRRDAQHAVMEGISSMGAVHAFGREVDEHQVTVLGEVPGATVELIAAGVRQLSQ
jgi:sigma-E factor negative regulatory protein RseB